MSPFIHTSVYNTRSRPKEFFSNISTMSQCLTLARTNLLCRQEHYNFFYTNWSFNCKKTGHIIPLISLDTCIILLSSEKTFGTIKKQKKHNYMLMILQRWHIFISKDIRMNAKRNRLLNHYFVIKKRALKILNSHLIDLTEKVGREMWYQS